MTVLVENRQRRVPVRLRWLRALARHARPRCQAVRGPASAVLEHLPEVEVAIVSDRTIARVHRDFMGLPEPTDVITFTHGEIVVSADTAQERAGEFGHGVDEELALYIVHGLLHLNGFDDVTPREAARMGKIQDRIWRECRSQLPPPA